MITLGVRDLDRAIAFYQTGLQLPKKPGSETNIAFFEMGSTLLGLYPRNLLAEDIGVSEVGSGFTAVAIAHNVASAEAVDALLSEAVAAGATRVKAGQKVFWGGYSGYFADPEGFYWEVAWNPYW